MAFAVDLNIIEPFRGVLKGAVHARQPKNLQDLEAFCKEEWADCVSSTTTIKDHKMTVMLKGAITSIKN